MEKYFDLGYYIGIFGLIKTKGFRKKIIETVFFCEK